MIFDRAKLAGGQTCIQREYDLYLTPVYILCRFVYVPWPAVQYATEKRGPPGDLCYLGANATFILYEDENDNYNYEKGSLFTITFRWDDRNRVCTSATVKQDIRNVGKEEVQNSFLVNHRSGEGDKPLKGGKMKLSTDGN